MRINLQDSLVEQVGNGSETNRRPRVAMAGILDGIRSQNSGDIYCFLVNFSEN
jgi:hypothetical protein